MGTPTHGPPKGEKVWVTYLSSDFTPRFAVTSKISNKDNYYLYEIIEDGVYKKLARAKSPNELEEKYNIKNSL